MNFCKIKIFDEIQPYAKILKRMQEFSKSRHSNTIDEIWILEHQPVYTYGAHTKPILPENNIPVIASDRGGNITYHAPGQMIIYPLLDTKRLNYSIHGLVERLEKLTLNFLNEYEINGHTISDKRGVYVNSKKIASIGLRFKKYCSYHGLAININLNLEPFEHIMPCGYNQEITSLNSLGKKIQLQTAINKIIELIPLYLELNIKELA